MRLHHLVTVFSLTSTALALPSPQNGAPAGRRQPSTQGAREVQWYEPLLAFGGIGAVATLGWAADKFYFKPGRNGQTPSSPTPNTGNGGNVIAQVGEAVDGPDRHALEGIRDQDITADMLTKGKVDWTKVDWELWGACLREKGYGPGAQYRLSDDIVCHRRVLDLHKAAKIRVREEQARITAQRNHGGATSTNPQQSKDPKRQNGPNAITMVEGAANKLGSSSWAFAASMPRHIEQIKRPTVPKYVPRPVKL